MTDHGQILDAAIDEFTRLGIKRTTTDDIARSAGLNRTTVYRQLGNKDEIVKAALLREVERFIASVADYVDEIDDFETRVTAGFAHTVLLLRSHPLLQRTLALKEYDALASVTVGAAEALSLGTRFVEQTIADAKTACGIKPSPHDTTLAALVTRIVHSLVVSPHGPPALHTEAELRTFARTHLLPTIIQE